MFNWIRRKRLSAEGKRRLLLAIARSEEAVIETHVTNIVHLLRTLQGEVDLDRAVELYIRMMSLTEARAASVTNRLYSRVQYSDQSPPPSRRFENVFRGGDDEGP